LHDIRDIPPLWNIQTYLDLITFPLLCEIKYFEYIVIYL